MASREDRNSLNMMAMHDFFNHGELREMRILTWPILILSMLLAACEPSADDARPAQDFAAVAQRIAHTSIIVDTHIDVPYRLQTEQADIRPLLTVVTSTIREP